MTSNDDNFHASSPIVDLTEQGCHTSYISGPTFSGTPAWTGSAPVSPDDIRHYTPSFEGEEFDEGRTAFSEVFSNSLEPNASEPSPRFEPFSHEPDMMSGFGGSDFNMYWYDHSLEDHMEWQSAPVSKNVLLPQAHTRSASVELCGSSGSQPHVLEDIFIGEPLIPTTYESNQPRSESRLYGRGASFGDYVQGGVTEPAAYEGKASLPFNPPTDPRSTHDGFDSPETWDQPPATHSLDLPPVTISPCSRPCSPPTNSRFTMAPILPSPGLPRKRHYSESAGTWSRPASHRDTLIVDTPLLCCSPSPVSENGSPCPQRRIHTALSMVKRHTKKERKQCSYCSDHSVWKPGQKIQLDDLPPELLIEIFTFACSSLPVKRKWTCEHQKVGSTQSGVMRRSTMNGAFPNRHNAMEQGKQPDNMLVDFYQRKFNLPRHLRLLQARTIRALQLTCKKFCHIFTQYPNVDNILWKEATIACWGHLPKTLAEVQGWNKASQTCWRNVFGVFMRSDNGMFKKRNAGGVGGVESFGGKSGFKGAVLWHEEKRLRAEANKLQAQEAATLRAISAVAKGKQKEVEDTSVPSTLNAINRRRLLLVCPQPGPDVFTVKALPEGDGYELGLCLQNKVTIFIRLDEHGDFSKIKRALPHDLRRSKKGRFPSDCFEVVGNRFKVVKVERGKIFNHNVPDIDSLHHHQGTERMQRTMTWDLECVPEYANDKRASVARCEHQKEYLVFNIFASREGFIEGLDKPSEDSRVFCVMAKGIPAHAELPTTHAGGIPRVRTCPPQWKGKMRASGHDGKAGGPSGGLRTVFQWQRRFVYPRAQDFTISQRLHYMICNFKLNSTFAVVLIRWNIHSRVSYHEFVDRSFQVLDLATGAIVKVLQFPNFHWDFRHHDMTVEYNVMRYYKMRRMYNALHAGNRATRIHGDQFTLDDRGRLVSGSHDYCNWMWDLNAEIYDQWPRERVFTPLHNDAGNGDPFVVLDDFYWEGENRGDQEHTGAWDTSNERAGWWVKTPNQVLCFWHNVTTSRDGRWFAAVRAGRMFVWDLEDTTKVQGFSCALGTYMGPATESLVDGGKSATPTAPHPTVETRYLGKVLNARLEKKLRSWHVWNGIIPEQGLWLMYDDGKVVYLDRGDILDACGLAQEGKQWAFNRDDFGNLDTDSEDTGDSMNHDDEDESMEDSEDEENAVVFVNEKLPVPEARRKRRRTSTITSMASRGSSFIADEAGLVIDMSEQFMFDNELPDAETWEKMDDEGWLKRVRQENGSVMEGSSRA